MFKPEQNSNENEGNITELLCGQYLSGVFQYVNYWINEPETAEEITLKVIKEVLVKYGNCCKDERKFSTGMFKCARKEITDYLKINTVKPIVSGLSTQEQEIMSLRLGARLNNRMISKLTGLSESKIGTIVCQSLRKLRSCMEVSA